VYTQNRNLVVGVIRAIISATEQKTSPDLFDVGDGSEPISGGETEDDEDLIRSESTSRVGVFARRPRRRDSRR
jgi:hypothetical protein